MLDNELIRYIKSNYLNFFNKEERLIYNSILNSQKLSKLSLEAKEIFSQNIEDFRCNNLQKEEENLFFEKVIFRIISEEKVYINRCPYCGTLARTPYAERAKCGHSWYNPNVKDK
ncbi:hypothetical protein ACFSJW_24655 [Flavobacterium artemisiae]|uniref:Uncharacterized protein n=1 Tax=Flavobacterium artemisiae TaxID=2126556 RepID=A0ABW4HB56_9FLAO